MTDLAMPQTPFAGQLQFPSHPGLSVHECPGMVQFQVICARGKLPAFVRELAPLEGIEVDGLFICATGPVEFWVFAENMTAHDAAILLDKKFGETASLFDQSHGRILLRIEGAYAADVLARGSPLDLGAAPPSGAAHTVIEHIPALVAWRDGFAGFDISIPRSFAGSFASWLAEAALEYAESEA